MPTPTFASVIQENSLLHDQNTRFAEMLVECIDCLEHGQPPEGLCTDKLVKKAKALVKEWMMLRTDLKGPPRTE
jgi:hypothetical protein